MLTGINECINFLTDSLETMLICYFVEKICSTLAKTDIK